MTLLDRVKELCNEKGISQRKLEQDLNLGNGASSKWSKSSPSSDLLQKIAEYFGVSLDYLLGTSDFKTKEELLDHWDSTIDTEKLSIDVQKNEDFSRRDKRDIANTMSFLLEQLDNQQDALMFDGEILDDDTRELLKDSLINSLKVAKTIAKQKFIPNKYRK